MGSESRHYEIRGVIRGAGTGKGIVGLRVEALDKDFIYDDRLGAVHTNADGRFQLRYAAADFREVFLDSKPDIYLRVYNAQGHLLLTTEEAIRHDAGASRKANAKDHE